MRSGGGAVGRGGKAGQCTSRPSTQGSQRSERFRGRGSAQLSFNTSKAFPKVFGRLGSDAMVKPATALLAPTSCFVVLLDYIPYVQSN